MTFRYIGSKSRLTNALAPYIGKPKRWDGYFVDLFCGTGVVAESAARLGWKIWVNDSLHCAATMAAARTVGECQAPFLKLGGYQEVVSILNRLVPEPGFLWREYSPASASRCGIERRYFTEENAARLDAMRAKIAAWERGEAIFAVCIQVNGIAQRGGLLAFIEGLKKQVRGLCVSPSASALPA